MEALKGDSFQDSALIIPLPQLTDEVQEIRRNHTKGGPLNLIPHITILYPFFNSKNEYLKNSDKLEKVCSYVDSFSLKISEVSEFSQSFVLFLKASETGLLKSIILKTACSFPEYPPYRGTIKIENICPHCTVAVAENRNDFDKIKEKYSHYLMNLLPKILQINELWLVVCSNSYWYFYKKLPLK